MKQLTEKNFVVFFDVLLKSIYDNTPDIIKILMKLIYMETQEIFTMEKNNYSPLFTILFFNFLISPKIQEHHYLNSTKNKILWNVNRIIRVCIFIVLF